MRTTTLMGLLILSLIAAPALFAQDTAETDGAEEAKETTGIQWTEDYRGALTTAKAEEKMLFIEFTATW